MDEQTGAPTPTQTPPVINEGPATLAQQIKAKHPEYEHIPDATLEAVAIAHNPEYAQLPRTHVSPQEAIAAMHQANRSNGDVENVKGGIAGAFAAKKPTGTEVSDALKAGLTDVGSAVAGFPSAVMHPVNTVLGVADEMRPHIQGAVEAVEKGQPLRAVGEAASSFPVVGPAANAIGEEMGRTGDLPRAVGRGAALIGMTAGPELAKPAGAAAEAIGSTKPGVAAADALANKGGELMAKGITPVRGAKAGVFADMAEKVGPQLATDPTLRGFTPDTLRRNLTAQIKQTGLEYKTAEAARLQGKPVDAAAMVQQLEAEKAKLTAQPLNASQIGPASASTPTGQNIGIGPGNPHPLNASGMAGKAVPMGQPVMSTSAHNAAYIQELDKAITKLKTLGPQASYEAIRTIRDDFDNTAMPAYTAAPADVTVAHANKGSAAGASKVSGIMRDTLAQADPLTAKINARYSMLKNADNVINALENSEATRPGTGRAMLMALGGHAVAGNLGAMVLPFVDVALRGGPSAYMIGGRILGQLAEALRSGDVTNAGRLMAKIRKIGGAGMAGNQARPEPVTIKEPQ